MGPLTGAAVFDTDLRLVQCDGGWVELMPDRAEALSRLAAAALAGELVHERVRGMARDGGAALRDLVLAPMRSGGEVVGVTAVVTAAAEDAEADPAVRAHDRLQARIEAFAAIADAMTLAHPLEQTLCHVARSVRSATGAEAAAVVVWEDEDLRVLSAYGDDGLPDRYREGVEEAYALGVRSPIRDVTTASGVTAIRGFRSRAEQDPGYAPLHPLWAGLTFEDTVVVPLGTRGRCVGCLLLYVDAGREVDADEQAFLQAIADQTAVAVENARLYGEAEWHATLVERQRLARELHDSVSQALFSMTLHARTAERRLAAHGVPESDPLAVSLATLSDLARGALAEMRALIFELRPGSLEADGLVAALTRQAQAVTAREGLPIEVRGPTSRLPLEARAEEHLYRLVLEALNNTVKHAGASSASVDVTVDEAAQHLTVVVHDDGRGFDPAAVAGGHLGQATMRDRAAAVGGDLTVRSAVGNGCTVTVVVPVAVGARP
ncbi:GAF domain-containing sensor histidine kinase [Phycicoccus sp.]|uniref:GAF domain-containing sensor histidine kinase n=1 Tax=Phycicoccus sp. TaxID=1902410 RepID=UPI002D171909|nr:GAF domain-containing sensor histidine kinase [Phycicoccus sp.]HMM95491.1 GAF domain-containing sensor histidine kinase [Phycicoccus sp.]